MSAIPLASQVGQGSVPADLHTWQPPAWGDGGINDGEGGLRQGVGVGEGLHAWQPTPSKGEDEETVLSMSLLMRGTIRAGFPPDDAVCIRALGGLGMSRSPLYPRHITSRSCNPSPTAPRQPQPPTRGSVQSALTIAHRLPLQPLYPPPLPTSHPHPPAGPSRVPSLSFISCRCSHPAAHIARSLSARELTLGEEGVEEVWI